MFYPSIRLLAPALALLGAVAAPAAAQDALPALRASVDVTADIVRIGDLVDNAGVVADVPIFRAPDLGTRGVVTTAQVVEAIRPHQLIDIDTRGLSQVIVTRASRTITVEEISAQVARALAGKYGFGEARNISVNFDHAVRTLHVEADATGDLEVVALAYDPRTARFDVSFDLPSSAVLHRLAPRFTGTAIATIDAVTVEHPVERGELLKASDLVIEKRPKSEGPLIGDISAAVGQAARHQLRPGQPLHAADVMKPAIVQRSDTVTLIYEAPGVTLTLRGQAQEAGALGDTINVLNEQSKRVVQGIVSGAGRVTVGAGPTRLAAEAPPAAADPPAASSENSPQQHRVSSAE